MKSIIIIIFLQISLSVFSQENNNKYYFDDGKQSNPKHILKTNLVSAIGGDFTLGYEAQIIQKYYLDFQIGYINHYFHLLDMLGDYNELFESPLSGHSICFHIKNKISSTHKHIGYWGFMYRTRLYNCPSHEVKTVEGMITIGAKNNIGGKWSLDYYTALGYRGLQKIDTHNTKKGRLLLNYCLSICYSL